MHVDEKVTQNKQILAEPRTIIALTREHLGDLICTTPALRSLKRRFPNAHLAVEVGERAACILANNPHVDEILLRPDHQGLMGKARFIRLLRKRKFDLAVILDDCADMALYVWLGGVPRRMGVRRKKKFAQLLTDSVAYDPAAHEMVDNFRNVVALLGADITDRRTEVFPTPEDAQAVETLLSEAGIDAQTILIGLNPGASAPANRWLPEHFAELGDRLAALPNVRVVLLGGPGDLLAANEIRSRMKTAPLFLTGMLTVLQLAELLRRCDQVVTGDTGPMHLAVAMRTPVVALFGPAVPHESGPGYAPGNVVIRKVEGCPACSKYECRAGRACMKAISAEEVAQVVAQRLTLRTGVVSAEK